MKTRKNLSHFAVAILVLTSSVCITSCEKDTMKNSNKNSPDLFQKMLKKTNGGKKAITRTDVPFSILGRSSNSVVFPPTAHMFGNSHNEWSEIWWQWALEMPPVANHPFNDDPSFDVTMGQSGNVWFLGTPFGTVNRTCTIPAGKSLFIGTLNFEASDLEGYGNTPEERLSTANFFADHIVPSSLFCTVDGIPVDLTSYRFVSQEFSLNVPTPWYYGATGGQGTAVSDGYFVMVKPFNNGNHTIHYGGAFHFSVAEGDPFDLDASADVTYNVTVQ